MVSSGTNKNEIIISKTKLASEEHLKALGFSRDFREAYFEYIERVLNNIDRACYIKELVHAQITRIDLHPSPSPFMYTSPALSTEYNDLFRDSILAGFPKTFKFLWPVTLEIYSVGMPWLNFLDGQQRRISNQKDVFRFYWTIYKGYQKKVNDELSLQIESYQISNSTSVLESLSERCISNRIKLRVDKTEYEMIRVIEEKWIPFAIKSKPVVWISNVENFVKDVFVCRDSLHSTKQYKYEITVNCAAHFIKMMRHLYYTSELFTATDIAEHKTDPSYQVIEFQLWLEFTFRNLEGFGEDNISRYFTDAEENMKGLEHYRKGLCQHLFFVCSAIR